MEPITLEFIYNENLTLGENTRRLCKKASLSAMEFFTQEPISDDIQYRYQVSNVSILGTSDYVNQALREVMTQFRIHLSEYLNSEDGLEEKLYQLDEASCILSEFTYANNEHSLFLLDKPDKLFVVHFNENMVSQELSLHQLSLNVESFHQIKEHLQVRNTYFSLLERFMDLERKRLMLKAQKHQLMDRVSDPAKTLQLLEVWIALEANGFLSHLNVNKGSVKLTELRRKFFELFGLSDNNYKSLREQLMDRKQSDPVFLIQLAEKFKTAIRKKGK